MTSTINNEMTLRDLIFKTREYFAFFWRRKMWILLIIGVSVALFLARAITVEDQYVSKLTFMINEDESNSGIGVLGSALGQFGLGGSGDSGYNLEKVIELANSRRIIQGVLLTKTGLLDTGRDYLANHLIRTYQLHEAWQEDNDLQEFIFTHDSILAFDRRERKALLQLYALLVGSEKRNGLISFNTIEETGILTMNATTRTEELSIDIPQILYTQLSQFYIAKSTEKQRTTFEMVSAKADSIKGALRSAEYAFARVADRSLGISLRKDRLREVDLRQEIQLLQIMYGETVRNMEASRFLLQSVTPFFQLIDFPISPLVPQKRGIIKKAILGGMLGSIIALLFMGGVKLYRDTVQ
jgi:hypothetical protein